MEVVLLAAGAGRRMKHLSNDRPKALVAVDGERPILQINLENILAVAPQASITVCGGYCYERLADFVAAQPARDRIRTVYNPAYLTEGPLRSIEIALSALPSGAEQVIIANGDTVYSEAVIAAAVDLGGNCSALTVSYDDNPGPDDMIVGLDGRNRRIASVAKLVGVGDPATVSAGFLTVGGANALQALREALDEAIEGEARTGKMLPWHSLVAYFARDGGDLLPLFVDRDCWHEFDSPECIEQFQTTGSTVLRLRDERQRRMAKDVPVHVIGDRMDAYWQALLGLRFAEASAALTAVPADLAREVKLLAGPTARNADDDWGIGQDETAAPAPIVTASAGEWHMRKTNNDAIILSGSLSVPTARVFIFVNGAAIKAVNTKVLESRGKTQCRFHFGLLKDIVRHFSPTSRVAIGSPAGPLLFNGDSLFTTLTIPEGQADLFELFDQGMFLSKKGSLIKPTTDRLTWQRKTLKHYERMRQYFEETFGYQLFFNYGSLLGLHREGDFIATDDDFDAGYLSREPTPETVKAEMITILTRMKQDGIKYIISSGGGFFKYKNGGAKFDIFPGWIEDGNLWMHNTTCLPASREMFEPIQTVTFKEREVYVPNQTEAFLRGKYGEGWNKPDPGYRPLRAPGTKQHLTRSALTDDEIAALRNA